MSLYELVVFVHTSGDVVIWAAFTVIALVATAAYVRGGVGRLGVAYPTLWRWGIGFLLSCGFTRLGEAFEIWLGPWAYTFTAALKVVTCVCAIGFVMRFWRVKDELIVGFQILNQFKEGKGEGE